MRKLLILLALLALANSTSAQIFKSQAHPDCEFGFAFTATGTAPTQPAPVAGTPTTVINAFDNRQLACTTWDVFYQSSGFSAVSLQLESAPDSSGVPGSFTVWSAASIVGTLPLTSTTGGQVTAYSYKSWVRINLTSVTGAGQVSGRVFGWRPWSGADASSGAVAVHGGASAGSPPLGNPILVAGFDGTNVQRLGTDSNGRLLVSHGSPLNSSTTGAPNTAVTTTLTGIAGQSIRIYRIQASCSAGTATLTVQDGAITIYTLAAAASFSELPGFPGWLIRVGTNSTVTLGTCGVGNSGTLQIIAVQY